MLYHEHLCRILLDKSRLHNKRITAVQALSNWWLHSGCSLWRLVSKPQTEAKLLPQPADGMMLSSSGLIADGSKQISSTGGGGRRRPHPADNPAIVKKDALAVASRNDVAVKGIQPDTNGLWESINSLAAVGKVHPTSWLWVQVAESRDSSLTLSHA